MPVVMSFSVVAYDDVQDMSDPYAVFTQAGAGYTDKGIKLKIGQVYDTGTEETSGVNMIKINGINGDVFGDEVSFFDNSVYD